MNQQNPKADAAVLKEWNALRQAGCWDESAVREWKDVAAEARRAGKKCHFGRIFEICVEKGSELPEGDPGRKFKGRVVFVFFGFTQCPDVCPTTMAELAEVKRRLGADGARVQGVFVTVDPERDTQQLMKGYVENFGPTFSGLTGTPDQVAAAARAFRVYYQKVPGKDGAPYLMDHSSIVYLLDRNGRFVTHFTHEAKAEAIAAGVQRFL